MDVAELITILQTLPNDAEVFTSEYRGIYPLVSCEMEKDFTEAVSQTKCSGVVIT